MNADTGLIAPSAGDSKYSIALRIWHPSIDPGEITARIAWEPSFSYMAGSPRRTPKGNALPGTNKDSFWYAEVPVEQGCTLSEVIDHLNRRLSPHAQYLDQLVCTGGKIEYFIGWFVGRNAGDTFSWAMLEACAALRISLAFDIYGSGNSNPIVA